MCLNLVGSYFNNLDEVYEICNYFGYIIGVDDSKIKEIAFNKKLLQQTRDIMNMGI